MKVKLVDEGSFISIKPKDDYAETPQVLDDSEEEIYFRIATYEINLNGESINWRHWVHGVAQLSSAQAACLMCALDPDLYSDLNNRHGNIDSSTSATQNARKIQREAETSGKTIASPSEWLQWAQLRKFRVHDGFRLEVQSLPKQTDLAPLAANVEVLPTTKTDTLQVKSEEEVSAEVPQTISQSIKKLIQTPSQNSSLTETVEIISTYYPRTAIGKLAVKAAIEIEQESKKRATAKQVMELLQKWADKGEEPDTLIKSDKPKHAVIWITSNQKDKDYTQKACEKTLMKWSKKRH